jgi:iron complex outermembrane receptor protein
MEHAAVNGPRRRTNWPAVSRPVIISLIVVNSHLLGQSESPPPSPIPESSAAAATAETERVIVTGSHIPTAAEVGPNPVVTLDRDDIEKAPERTTEQLLRDLPLAGANGVPLSNNGTGFAPGASSVSLRGFDASATLVLIDGRRVAPYPVGTGGLGTQTFVDLNSIPRAAIDAIEILKDGASTTYGADAVAGVVNIKFRHDYRGAETQIEYGNTLDKDNGEFASSLAFGAGDDTTDITGALNYYHRNDIFNRDRGFSNGLLLTVEKSTGSNPGQFFVTQAAALAAGVPASDLPNRSSFVARPPRGTDGLASPNDYSYYPRLLHLFNFNMFASSFPKAERYGGFVNFDHKICGDQLVIYGDFFHQTARNEYQLAPTPLTFQAPGEVPVAIPPHAPGPTLGGPTYQDTGLSLGAFNPFNPFQQIISGRSRYRLVDFPNRIVDDATDAFMSTAGLKGDKLFDGSWGYDAGFRYSEIEDVATGNEVSRSRFSRILNAADPIFNPASSEFIGTTVPYNPFGDYRHPIPSNADTIAFATVHPIDEQLSKLTTLDLNIYTTSLFKLPAGGVGLALGGQFRREEIAQNPSQLLLEGDILGTLGQATETVAGRKSFGLYAETRIPLFSPEMKVPGLYSLDLTSSTRFEDYLNNNTNILIPKVGLRWQPFDDSLTIRSTWGEGFREPSLFELYNSPSTGSSFVFDRRNPGGPAPIANVDTLLISNPNLQPEDSRNFTAGIVYTPKFLPGLTATVDYFVIERHDVVGVPNPQDVLNREGHPFPGEAVVRDSEGFLVEIIAPYENNGGERAEGFDFGLQYQRQTSFGTFTSLTQATYLDSFRLAISRTAPALEVAGQNADGGSQDAYLKWKGRSRLDYTWNGFTLSGTVTYIDGFHEILFTDPSFPDGKKEHWVHQTWIFDGQLSYTFHFAPAAAPDRGPNYAKEGKEAASALNLQTFETSLPCWKKLLDNTTIKIGCNNIFGQDPPRTLLTPQNYPGFIYDSVGRFCYVELKKKF